MADEEETPKVYFDENPFIELFGGESKSVMKILNVLMSHSTLGYTKKDLAEVTGLGESTVLRNWKYLSKHDIIEKKGEQYGNTQYKLNQDSDIVKKLYELGEEIRKFREEETDLAEYRELETEED